MHIFKSEVFLLVYAIILAIVNLALIIAILYTVMRRKVRTGKRIKTMNLIGKDLNIFLVTGDPGKLKKLITTKYRKKIALDMLIDHAERTGEDISDFLSNIGFDHHIKKKSRFFVSYLDIRYLSYLRASDSYDTLMRVTHSGNQSKRYLSFYALSHLSLDREKIESVLENLFKSGINRDRIVEIVDNFSLSTDECFRLLKSESTSIGKDVFLRVLQSEQHYITVEMNAYILSLFNETTEVKIAAINAISSSHNPDFFELLKIEYQHEERSEVKIALVKAIAKYDNDLSIPSLKKMAYSDIWWVRFNAIKSLAAKGENGILALVDLSLDDAKDDVSSLAYYFLNADRGVRDSIKRGRSEVNGS